jgi:hypothetical protein
MKVRTIVVECGLYISNLKRTIAIEVMPPVAVILWHTILLTRAMTIPMHTIAANLLRVKVTMIEAFAHKIRINGALPMLACGRMRYGAMLFNPFQ